MGVSFTFLPIAREVVVSEIAAGNSGKDAYGKFLGPLVCLVWLNQVIFDVPYG